MSAYNTFKYVLYSLLAFMAAITGTVYAALAIWHTPDFDRCAIALALCGASHALTAAAEKAKVLA